MKRKIIRVARKSAWIVAVKLVVLLCFFVVFVLLAAVAHVPRTLEASDTSFIRL